MKEVKGQLSKNVEVNLVVMLALYETVMFYYFEIINLGIFNIVIYSEFMSSIFSTDLLFSVIRESGHDLLI